MPQLNRAIDYMKNLWQWLLKPENQGALKILGACVVAVAGAAWVVFTYFHNPETPAPSPVNQTQINVGEMRGGYVAGRDQYVTNIDGMSPERFQSLSEELGVTKSALKSFFKILKKNQVPPEDLDSTLRQIATRYKDLEVELKHFTSEDPDVVALKRQAAEALDASEFDKAEGLLNQAKEKDIQGAREFQELAHKRFLSAAATAAQTAELKNTQLAYVEAAEYYRQAAELIPQGEEKVLARYLTLQALVLIGAGKYFEAETPSRRALEIREQALSPDHTHVATSLNNLALLYMKEGKYAQAEPLYQRALAIRETALGPDHPDVATSLNNLASLYSDQGKYAQAESLCQRALAIREKALSPDHPYVAQSLNNLAFYHRAQGKYAQAEPLYERALVIYGKALGPVHPDLAKCLGNMAVLYKDQGKYAQAEPLYQRSQAIFEKVFGFDHPDVAQSMYNLAGFYDSQGKYAQAESLYQRSLAMREKALGPDHPDVATSLKNLAVLYRVTNREKEAVVLEERAARIRAIDR